MVNILCLDVAIIVCISYVVLCTIFFISIANHPQKPVDIMLAMFSWMLEILLHTEYLTYLLHTYHHWLQ